jgi:hypothetical protein
MGLKDLFIVSEENSENKPVQEPVKQSAPSTTKFPSSEPKLEAPTTSVFSSFGFGSTPTPTPTPTYQPTNVSNEALAKTADRETICSVYYDGELRVGAKMYFAAESEGGTKKKYVK